MIFSGLLLLQLSSSPVITASPVCVIDEKRIFFHVPVRSEWKKRGVVENRTNLYQVTCSRKTRECTGALLNMKPESDSSSQPIIGLLDLQAIIGARLKSVVGQVATIVLGMHQFVVDAGAGTVTLAATALDGTAESGNGQCQTIPSPK